MEPDPALVDLASARLDVRRAIASITEDSETAQSHLLAANKTLTQVVETLRPDAKPDVQAAQESVQQASERVEAVTETARKVDTEVTVYTTDGCPGCFATKRALDKAGVEYEEVNLQEHPELVDQFKRQLGRDGQKVTAPFVTTKDGDLWAGYNPEKLKEHGLDIGRA
ncbi:MAG: glutaredoxin family protein, partial [Brevibacterium aurantiacum]|nr:glutaredoxin family protein [Brevibacterium aurantiacum]